ncbi:hypothetical protein DYI25_09760 [Mesobacillus boroniphilus]|uniref:Uncharacterized protein n=1 Tax=Mesobacillus boroniphilus TaxID=308892 RepID=A0A944CLG8_9BACI|nr:hypothetical protein [Mesobacillus boroniphilus]MBS8264722.1 hypothetical protein [Mesobacillus boroniphilus]
MLWKVFRLVIGLFCGYLVVNWMTVVIPFHSDEFLGEFIFNPFEFLAMTIALVFGMYSMGGLIRGGAIAVISILKGIEWSALDLMLAIACLGCFFLLLALGVWQTAIFFVFCLLYGMMSFSSTEDECEDQI